MAKYEYLPIEQAKKGDIVERIKNQGTALKIGTLCIVDKDYKGHGTIYLNKGTFEGSYFKLIKTKPGKEVKVGDEVIFIGKESEAAHSDYKAITGKIYIARKRSTKDFIYYNDHDSNSYTSDFLVLCKEGEENTYQPDKSGFEYLPIKEAKIGDIIECISQYGSKSKTVGKLYLLEPCKGHEKFKYTSDTGNPGYPALNDKIWKLVKTKPSNEAQLGDTLFCINSYCSNKKPQPECTAGLLYECKKISNSFINGYNFENFVVICKKDKSTEIPSWEIATETKDGKFIPSKDECIIGKKFEVVTAFENFPKGTIVELAHDDKTSCPTFRNTHTGYEGYCCWYRLKPLTEPFEGHNFGECGHTSIPAQEHSVQITPLPRIKKYYSYFKVLFEKGIPLEVCDPRPINSYWQKVNSHNINYNDGSCLFRLANHPNGCPDPNTQEYLDYWQTISDSGKTVFAYSQSGDKYHCKIPNNVIVGYRTFFLEDVTISLQGADDGAILSTTANSCSEIPMGTYTKSPFSKAYNSSEAFYEALRDSYKYSHHTSQNKGDPMEPQIVISMTEKEYEKHVKKHHASACLVPKTQLEAKLPFCMITYTTAGEAGEADETFYNKTEEGVLKRKDAYLQNPANLGKTVTVHRAFGEFTTAIPVVEVQTKKKKAKKKK